jgi:hypothetical protein
MLAIHCVQPELLLAAAVLTAAVLTWHPAAAGAAAAAPEGHQTEYLSLPLPLVSFSCCRA